MATSSSSASLFLVIFSTAGHPVHKREKLKFPAKKKSKKIRTQRLDKTVICCDHRILRSGQNFVLNLESGLDHKKSLQALHCRAARLIYNLPWDTPSQTVMEVTNWDSIYDMYKIHLVKLFYNIVSDNTPPLISNLAMWRETRYNLRGLKKATVPRFSTQFMKHSIRFRGAVLWNFV